MDYVLCAIGMPFNGESLETQSLGGSETAAASLSIELAKRGHRVCCWSITPNGEDSESHGVRWMHVGNLSQAAPLGDRFTHYATNTPIDVLIIQRHPLAFHKDYSAKVNIWQLHDLALHRFTPQASPGLLRVDAVTGVSRFHCDQINEVYGARAYPVRNGIDPELYAGEFERHELIEDPEAFNMLFQSRPERGLEHLVRPGGIMARLAQTLPRVHLYIVGYENTTNEMAPYYQRLAAWAADLPNVTWGPPQSKRDLARLQRSCDLLCYPTEFEEVSCITAMEAMAADLPMLTSHVGALPETCAGSGTKLLALKDGRADEDAFVRWISAYVASADEYEKLKRKQCGTVATTWGDATTDLEQLVERQLIERQKSASGMVRHLIEHSDIRALDYYLHSCGFEQDGGPEPNAIIAAAIRERREMYAFIDSREALAKHYDYWENWNYDRMRANGSADYDAEQAQIEGLTRVRGILSFLQGVLKPGMSVLDYGCAHGHMTILLARLFPDVQFVGMDMVPRAIEEALRYAQHYKLENASFGQGDQETLAQIEPGAFDVVIAAEVVEHVWDCDQLLRRLRRIGKHLILTTPTGRWEWTGHEMWPKGREHVHHFDRQDLLDLFPAAEILFAPAGPDQCGQSLGSFVTYVPPEAEQGAIDYDRKLREAAPRQTVSLCMIVKDGERTLRGSLDSVLPYVDEVIVGIDPATTDRTRDILLAVREDYPHKAFTIFDNVPALQDGFAAARNATIERACGDWILWMDADETVPQAFNIWRCLHPSSFDGFATPQLHYSAQPAEVLTTDYPVRLFRNRIGVKFYGHVHEHPETTPGKSVPNTSLLPDVQFLHSGYVTEATRRKRFERNYPLLLRDVKENPERVINRFLHLRDLAQLTQFERERGIYTDEQVQRAHEGIRLFEELVDAPHLRMVLDGVQYYSSLVDLLGLGFEAEFKYRIAKPPHAATVAEGSTVGRFHDRAVLMKLLERIATETTKHYDSPYL